MGGEREWLASEGRKYMYMYVYTLYIEAGRREGERGGREGVRMS